MSDIGRTRRWSRFTDAHSGKALIVPIDHGLTFGPIAGLNDLSAVRGWLGSGGLTGTIMHKGMVERVGGAPGVGLMVHLNGATHCELESSASTGLPSKPLLTSVDAALHLGADAVSVHLDMSPQSSAQYLCLLSQVVEQAHQRGMPVLAMLYDKTDPAAQTDLKRLRHFMRAAIEVGADVLKVLPPKDLQWLPALLDGMQSHTPVLLAGGQLKADGELLALAEAVVRCGGAGLCVGRNVFQRGQPADCLARVSQVLHKRSAPRRVAAPDLPDLPSVERERVPSEAVL